MACNHPIKIRADGLSQSARLSAHISLKGVSFHVVGMFLLPSTSPKLRTLTAYAARAMGAKLSFAYSLVTYKAVNPQFSTFLINTCRSCFAPIKSTLALPFRVFLGSYLPSYRFTVTQCTHGGGVGYCPQVQSAFRSASLNCIIFIT